MGCLTIEVLSLTFLFLYILQRCIENLRKSRAKFVNRFRGADGKDLKSYVKDVMTEEWKVLREENKYLPTCSELLFHTDDEEIKYLNTIIDEIQDSLRAEGLYILYTLYIHIMYTYIYTVYSYTVYLYIPYIHTVYIAC